MRAARSRTQGEEAQLCSTHGLVGTHQMQQLLPPQNTSLSMFGVQPEPGQQENGAALQPGGGSVVLRASWAARVALKYLCCCHWLLRIPAAKPPARQSEVVGAAARPPRGANLGQNIQKTFTNPPKLPSAGFSPHPQARRCGLLTPFVFPSSREARRLPVRHRLDGRYLF